MRKGDAKRKAILDTAQRLFYQKGFEQTSVQDILNVLKCSKGSFYHHFESKLSVLETLCARRAQEAAEQAKKAAASCQTPMDKINALSYYLMPLRKGEERFMALLLPLSATKEGVSLSYQYARALSDSFGPLWDKAIHEAMEQEICFPVKRTGVSPIVITLLNQCWQLAAQQVMGRIGCLEPMEPGELLPLLDVYRGAIERLLDAPFGSLEIINLNELCQVCTQVLNKLRMEI